MWVGHDSFISNGRVIHSFKFLIHSSSLVTLKQSLPQKRGRQMHSWLKDFNMFSCFNFRSFRFLSHTSDGFFNPIIEYTNFGIDSRAIFVAACPFCIVPTEKALQYTITENRIAFTDFAWFCSFISITKTKHTICNHSWISIVTSFFIRDRGFEGL